MEKLSLIVSAPCVMAGVDFSKSESLIKEAIDKGHKVCVLYYFHGEVEDFAKYDIGACLNAEHIFTEDTMQLKDGIYDAELREFEKPLKAFLWNTEDGPKGLIVCSTNAADMKFAKEKYESRTPFL